jgi:hypothetical protein
MTAGLPHGHSDVSRIPHLHQPLHSMNVKKNENFPLTLWVIDSNESPLFSSHAIHKHIFPTFTPGPMVAGCG